MVSKSQSPPMVSTLPDRTDTVMANLYPQPNIRFHNRTGFLSFILNSQFSICIYTLPIFTLTLLLPKLSEGNQVARLRQEINSIKANEKIFETLLSQQPFYEVSDSDSNILFPPSLSGRDGVGLTITILTNPFCNPCAKMHARAEKLITGKDELHSPSPISPPEPDSGSPTSPASPPELDSGSPVLYSQNICLQYIFSAFNESLEYANRYFIAIYLEQGIEAAWQLYSDWFEKGKSMQEAFFNDLHLDMTNPAIEIEFQKHRSWKEQTQLQATPTILVNGYKLPDNHKIEDLQNIADFKIDIT